MEQELEKQREAILKQLEEWHNDSLFVINDREYKISKLSHQFRLEVISIYSQIEPQILTGNYSFLQRDDFKKIIKKVDDKILFEDLQLSKRQNHFEEYPEDYLDYVAISLKVICYPLYRTKLHIGLTDI